MFYWDRRSYKPNQKVINQKEEINTNDWLYIIAKYVWQKNPSNM